MNGKKIKQIRKWIKKRRIDQPELFLQPGSEKRFEKKLLEKYYTNKKFKNELNDAL